RQRMENRGETVDANVGRWDRWHKTREQPHPMGLLKTYEKAIAFLDADDDWTIEDWGGGTGYARRYIERADYVLVDGSQSKFVEKVEDLTTYRTVVDCILLRHVLEHNAKWEAILDNALESFTKRMVIVCF